MREHASEPGGDEHGGPVIAFLAITFAGSIAISALVGVTGGHESPLVGLGLLAMFVPAVGVLAVRLVAKARIRDAGWKRFPLRYVPVALLLLPAITHIVVVPGYAVLEEGGIPWAPWLTPADGVFHVPEERGWGDLSAAGLAGRIALNLIGGLLIVSALVAFEEIGWRAWLLPRLAARFGWRRAIVIGALIWGAWHVPYSLSGIHHLAAVPLGIQLVVLPLGITGAGLVIGWLWHRTRSMWIVTLAHGALNNWGSYALKYMESSGQHDALLLGANCVAICIVGAVLVARTPAGDRDPGR